MAGSLLSSGHLPERNYPRRNRTGFSDSTNEGVRHRLFDAREEIFLDRWLFGQRFGADGTAMAPDRRLNIKPLLEFRSRHLAASRCVEISCHQKREVRGS